MSMSIMLSAAVERGVRSTAVECMRGVIAQLASDGLLTCTAAQAEAKFNFATLAVERSVSKSVTRKKKVKTAKPSMTVPFCGVVVEDWCQAVRLNHGLHTQCSNRPRKNGEFCATCQKHVDNSPDGTPPYGAIQERAKFGTDYRDPKGKLTLPFANVAKKLGLDVEKAKKAAAELGWTIPEEQLTMRTRGKRAAKTKSAAVSDTESEASAAKKLVVKKAKIKTQDDLISKLVQEAANEVASVSSVESVSTASSGQSKSSKGSKKAATVAALTSELSELGVTVEAGLKVGELRKKLAEAKKAAKLKAKEDAKAAKLKAKEDAKAAKLKAKEDAKEAKRVERVTAQVLKVNANAEVAGKTSQELTALLKSEKEAAKMAAKAAKIQVKCDAVETEILTFIELNKLSADDEAALRNQVQSVQEHDVSYLVSGVTMGGLKDILKEQKKIQRAMVKKAAKKAKAEKETAEVQAAMAAAAAPELEEEEAEDELVLTEEMKFEHDGVSYFKTTAYGQKNMLFTLEGEPVGIFDEDSKTIQEVEFEDD